MEFSGKHPRTRDTKRAHIFHHNCGFFHKNSQVHNSKSKMCTKLFKNNNNLLKIGEIIVCPFFGALKLERAY